MQTSVFDFLKRHSSLIITTHDNPDADGLGAEMVFYQIALSRVKKVRVINSGPVPDNYRFMDPENIIEAWNEAQKKLPKNAGLMILDASDEYNIGKLREFIPRAAEVFIIDHHEPNKVSKLKGYVDSTASSTCEIVTELAGEAGIKLTPETAMAAYTGIVYDTGFFAYSKTTSRTFRIALSLVEAGVKPYDVYRKLNENDSTSALLLQKKVLSTLELNNRGRVAVQILRKEALEECNAGYEDAEHFVSIPLKSRDIEVSIMIKENREGQIRCSLRSKGNVNVSKVAQSLGGGGHVAAAGFKSTLGIEDTLGVVLGKIAEELD